MIDYAMFGLQLTTLQLKISIDHANEQGTGKLAIRPMAIGSDGLSLGTLTNPIWYEAHDQISTRTIKPSIRSYRETAHMVKMMPSL